MSSPNSSKMAVSEQLEQLLHEKGITHQELANRLGVSRPAVTRMLHPGYDGFSVPTLRRIAEALGVGLEVSFKGLEVKPYRYDVIRIAAQWRTRQSTAGLKTPRTEDDYLALTQLDVDIQDRFGPSVVYYEGLLEVIRAYCEEWRDQSAEFELIPTNSTK